MSNESQGSYWESAEVVVRYSTEPYLFLGEELALRHCYPDGLQGSRVLDLGCGGGRVAFFLHEMGGPVIGADYSAGMVRAARRRNPDVDFFVMNAERLAFDDESFDLVMFAYNGLDCLYPQAARLNAIEEILRVLRPGGFFVVSHHNLAALLFGWHRYLRPRKLIFRATQILNGNFFNRECYIQVEEGGHMYFAWPGKVIADLQRVGFEFEAVFPNNRPMDLVRRIFGITWPTRWTDLWPYYVFGKPASPPSLPDTGA